MFNRLSYVVNRLYPTKPVSQAVKSALFCYNMFNMYLWQPTSKGEITRVPGRRPLVHPDLQNSAPTKNMPLRIFAVGFLAAQTTFLIYANGLPK